MNMSFISFFQSFNVWMMQHKYEKASPQSSARKRRLAQLLIVTVCTVYHKQINHILTFPESFSFSTNILINLLNHSTC